MRFILKNKTILIERQPIVELSTNVPVQIIREPGTERLTFGRIIVNGVQQISNIKPQIDFSSFMCHNKLKIEVELVDSLGTVINRYVTTTKVYPYLTLEYKPVRNDIEQYVDQLQTTIKSLENTIKELQEKGEVV